MLPLLFANCWFPRTGLSRRRLFIFQLHHLAQNLAHGGPSINALKDSISQHLLSTMCQVCAKNLTCIISFNPDNVPRKVLSNIIPIKQTWKLRPRKDQNQIKQALRASHTLYFHMLYFIYSSVQFRNEVTYNIPIFRQEILRLGKTA